MHILRSLCFSLNPKSTFHKRVDLHRVGRKILPNFWAFCLSLRIVNLQPLLQTTIHKTCSPPTLHESKYLALHFQDSLYLQIPSAWHWCKPPKILVNFLFLLKKRKKKKVCFRIFRLYWTGKLETECNGNVTQEMVWDGPCRSDLKVFCANRWATVAAVKIFLLE